MLSSSMVAVLAPHWTGRLRRTKRFNITEAQGNSQDATDTAVYDTREHFQETAGMSLTDGSQAQLRVPFVITGKNTLDWSANSGPARVDYESRRKYNQSVSLDVNSGKMDNKDAGSSSRTAKTLSPVSSHSLDLNEQRRNLQIGHEGLSSISSKPTTSSLLLSLRKFNSIGRILTADPAVTEINPLPLNSSKSDQAGQLFTTQLSQNSHNNNTQEMSGSLLSPSAISYGTTETGPIKERTSFEKRLFSTTKKEPEDAPFVQTMNRTHPSLSSSNQVFLTREQSERLVNCQGSDKSTRLLLESSVSPTRHSPYDHSPLQKTQSLPRPILTSSSWWKQVTQEGNSLLKFRDKAKLTDEPSLPDNLPSPSVANDNISVSGQILDSKNNNSTTESVCKSNVNLVMKTQGGTHSLKQRNTEDLPEFESNLPVKQKFDFNSNIKEPRKSQSLPDVVSSSKNGRGATQTIAIYPKHFTQHNISDISFVENVAKVQPTLPNPKNTHTSPETCRKYSNNNYASKNNSIHPFSHNKEPQIVATSFPSVASANIPSQGLTCKTGSGFPLTTNTILPDPLTPQTSSHASSYIGTSYQTSRFTTKTSPTPLGFERSYSFVPKPLHPKTVSSLIPTVNVSSKSKFIPVPPTSSVSSSTTSSHPTATTVSSPSLLTTPATPTTSAHVTSPTTVTTFLLTPPGTPIATSPNYSDNPSPKEGTTFSNSQERDTKKRSSHTEGKKVRRVTWQDCVDIPCSESRAEVTEPIRSPSPTRSPQHIKAPAIFSLLRSNSSSKSTHRLSSFTPKTSSIQVKGERYRSLSSDSADLASGERERSQQKIGDSMISDQSGQDLTTPRHQRALSLESGTSHSHSSAPLSHPPDFSSGYTLRYSSPPYSALMSTRCGQGQTKAIKPRSPLFLQPTKPIYTPYIPTHKDPDETMTSQITNLHWPNSNLPQPLSLPYKAKTAPQESSKSSVTETDKLNNNHVMVKSQNCQNGHRSPVRNRVQFSSVSLQTEGSSSTGDTETLVYVIKSKADAPVQKNTTSKRHASSSPASLRTNLDQQSQAIQSQETAGCSNQGFSAGSSTYSQPFDNECSNKRMKESVVGKSRCVSVESNNEQSPKRSRFALKKSVNTPNSGLSKSESERVSKTNNKMDQVFNRLRQTFSTKRSEDDSSFPWKWKRASQTPSVSGSSDISTVSDTTLETTKNLRREELEEGTVLRKKEKERVANPGKQNNYTLTTTSTPGKPARDKVYNMPEKLTSDTDQDRQTSRLEHMSKKQPQLRHNQTTHQFEFYKDNGRDYTPPNQFLSCRDPSSEKSANPSAAYPSQFRKSSSSPRSPFSPFSSLSPFSLVPSPDVTDDNVFYSPKLYRRRDSSSPCEPGEGISLGGSRRSRVSTGPVSPGLDNQCFASSYADLKYGIEPGKSFSVSSVLSCRPSGPGRISTGSRFMSVGDLYESALTCGDTGKDYDFLSRKDCRMLNTPGNDGKIRSRSLPRSLTRRLANWTSGVSAFPPDRNSASKLDHLWKTNLNAGHLAWDTESPPTPPATPPLSPVSRQISTPPSHSSPPFPSSSGVLQEVESQSSRGQMLSRGYISNLSTFEELSDSSSDTTTDDEYYLETGEDEEKETEL
ncbi:uncharacterized protein zmp:0000000991 [Antennarius striatus]|uniref:uncharacterized protein zmp:0000000991 n=1 Tax=Antennarius striatus TaxID=241820 RepID=UPI0035B2E45D